MFARLRSKGLRAGSALSGYYRRARPPTLQHVTLSEVACRTQSLEILVDGVSASAPGNDVVNMKSDARQERGAGSTGATRKIIALHDPKAGTKRWVSAGLVASGSIERTWWNYVLRICIRYKLY